MIKIKIPNFVELDSAALCAVFALIILIRCLATSAYHDSVNKDSGIYAVDYRIFYAAAARVASKQPLYQVQEDGFTYVYPPPLAFCMAPLTRFGVESSFKLWTGFNITLTVAAATACLYALSATRWSFAMCALALLMAFRFWPTTLSLAFGQTNSILLFLTSLCLVAQAKNRHRLMGVFIALGALIKPWMLLCGLYFLIKRRWDCFICMGAVFVLAMVISFCLLDSTQFSIYRDLTLGFIGSTGSHFPSESIIGFARLHFANNSYVQPIIDNKVAFYAFVIVCFSPIAYFCFSVFRASKFSRENQRDQIEFATCVVVTLLCSPLMEPYYLVLTLPLMWALLFREYSSKLQNFAIKIATLLLYFLLTRPWPTLLPFDEKYKSGPLSLLVSAEFFILLGLLILGVYASKVSLLRKDDEIAS